MMSTLRRTTLLAVAAMVAALMAFGGVAWTINAIQCPNTDHGTCAGSQGDDRMTGTDEADGIYAGSGGDVIYGMGGDDHLEGHFGRDEVHGGPGSDWIGNEENDYWFGEDRNYGDNGADILVGQLNREKHYGGPGNDHIYDYKSGKRADYFSCGPGHDKIWFNRGLDKVDPDCEVREAMGRGYHMDGWND